MFNIFHKRKLLSTIIPVFNSSEFLEQCLDSVCKQAIDDHEIIVINDNSTDLSPAILSRYKKRYPFIQIAKNKKTFGPGFSRNLALTMAKGKYISFVDSDDYLGEQYFQTLINRADNTSSDIVFSDYRFIGEDTSRCRILSIDKDGAGSKRWLLANASNAPWAKLYSSEFIKRSGLRFHNSSLVGEDIPFVWLSYVFSKKIDCEPNAVYFYRLNPAGCDNIIDRRMLGILDSLEELKKIYKKEIKEDYLGDLLIYLMLGNIHYNFQKIDRPSAAGPFISEYLARSRNLLADFPAREIVDNNYLSEQQKLFYTERILGQ